MWAETTLAAGGVVGFGRHAHPMMHGSTDEGYMTLLDCRQVGMRMGMAMTHRFRVASAIQGVRLRGPDEEFIRRVEVEATSEYKWTAKPTDTAVEIQTVPRATLTSRTPRSLDYWASESLNPMNQLCANRGRRNIKPALAGSLDERRMCEALSERRTDCRCGCVASETTTMSSIDSPVLFDVNMIDRAAGGLPQVLEKRARRLERSSSSVSRIALRRS